MSLFSLLDKCMVPSKTSEDRLGEGVAIVYGIFEKMTYELFCKIVKLEKQKGLLNQDNTNLRAQILALQNELLGIQDLGAGI